MSVLYHLEGVNFSGRSEALLSMFGEHIVHIGSNSENFLSGLAPKINIELALHSSNHQEKKQNFINDFALDKLFTSHPSTLSGGEKALFCLFEHLLLDKEIICVDNALEQMSREWREKFLDFINREFPEKKIYLSDNRIDEYKVMVQKIDIEPSIEKKYPISFTAPKFEIGIPESKTSELQSFRMSHLTFSYDKKQKLFDNFSMELSSGTYRIYGNNGTGKSTLSKIISGMVRPSKGKMLLNEMEVEPFRHPGSISGFSFQNPSDQIFEQTVERQVLGSQNRNEDRLNHILQLFGLENLRHLHPEDLPYVMKKRIGIASALYPDKPIYLLDEPTLGQDYSFLLGFATLLNQLASNGKIVLVISHSENFIHLLENCKNIHLKK